MTHAPIVHRSMHATQREAREVALTLAPEADLSHAYQRGSVWTEDQRQALVRSWLIGLPIPSVIINNRGVDHSGWPKDAVGVPEGGHFYAVIDGKQRIEAARAWFQGELLVPAKWFSDEDCEFIVHGANAGMASVSFNDLPATARRVFSRRAMLPVVETAVGSLNEEAELYLLVNGAGTAQTAADIANAEAVAHG